MRQITVKLIGLVVWENRIPELEQALQNLAADFQVEGITRTAEAQIESDNGDVIWHAEL